MQTSVFDWKSKGRMTILVVLTAMVVFILWNLFQLVKQTEIDERHRMEVWALAQKQFVKDIDLNDDVDPLIFEVLTSENSIPMIVVDEYDNIVSFNNIDPQRALLKDSLLLKNTLKDLIKQNDPIEIVFENAVNQRMYYGQSSVLEKLKLYPGALLLLLLTIGALVFFYLRTFPNCRSKQTLDGDGQRDCPSTWHTHIIVNGMGFHVKNKRGRRHHHNAHGR